MFYRIFGWWIRMQACRMTAIAMQNHSAEDDITPRAWSFTVFFESYIMHGAEWTSEDFGPKEPVELKPVVNANG